MPIGDRYTPHGPSWTIDSFSAAISSSEDKARAAYIFDSLESDTSSYYWFGQRPGGAVFPHPRGLRYAPMSLSLDEHGLLLGQGAWKRYPKIKNDEGFAELAAFVGQDHEGTASKFVVSEFNVMRLWEIANRCADRINGN